MRYIEGTFQVKSVVLNEFIEETNTDKLTAKKFLSSYGTYDEALKAFYADPTVIAWLQDLQEKQERVKEVYTLLVSQYCSENGIDDINEYFSDGFIIKDGFFDFYCCLLGCSDTNTLVYTLQYIMQSRVEGEIPRKDFISKWAGQSCFTVDDMKIKLNMIMYDIQVQRDTSYCFWQWLFQLYSHDYPPVLDLDDAYAIMKMFSGNLAIPMPHRELWCEYWSKYSQTPPNILNTNHTTYDIQETKLSRDLWNSIFLFEEKIDTDEKLESYSCHYYFHSGVDEFVKYLKGI